VRGVAERWTLKQVQGDDIRCKEVCFAPQRHPELVSGSIERLAQFRSGRAKGAAK
jgi:hypothetical protein